MDADHAPQKRSFRRQMSSLGIVRNAQLIRPSLASDERLLVLLVSGFFVMGFVEAGVIMLIVQMAVAMAAGADTFSVQIGPIDERGLTMATGVVLGFVGVGTLLALLIPTAMLNGRIAARAQNRLRRRILAAYLAADWSSRSRHAEGHLQELMTVYSIRSENGVNQLIQAAIAACGLVALLSVAFVASPITAGLALVCVAGVGFLLRPLLHRTRAASQSVAVANTELSRQVAEVARITPEVATFDVGEPVRRRIEAQADDVEGNLRTLRILMRLGSSLYQYIAMLLVIAGVGLLTRLSDGDGLATMGTVVLLLVRALSYGQALQSQIQASNETAPFLEQVETEIAELTGARIDRRGVDLGRPTPLAFAGVGFAYDDHHPVFSDLDLEIAAGETIGVVGPSGAGKSTLIQLMLRLRVPTAGAILADGVPLHDIALDQWYEAVAYVPQDNQLINGTVADNIRFFRSGFDEAQVVEAARLARLHDDVAAFPEGYATLIGPGLRQLSGGQRQRLGIARALLGNPRLLILDEPTSALDARSETLVVETLAGLRGSVALVIVAHRDATTAICDRLVHLRDGTATVAANDGFRPDLARVDPSLSSPPS